MQPVSVCIIAKNEEKHIEECCRRLKPYGFEIVVVDTGSSDRTTELAGKYTDRIYRFDWCDDFSAAKNYALQKASHDWILSLDCDEYIESLNPAELQKCMMRYPNAAGRILIRNRFTENGKTAYEQVRVSRFINRLHYHFEGAIHEQLVPIKSGSSSFSGDDPAPADSPGQTGLSAGSAISKYVYSAPVTVLHVGYDGDEDEMNKKSRRNIVLLKKELKAKGPDPYLYYQLGQSYRKLHDYENACQSYDLGLAMDVNPDLDYVQTMVESYGYTLLDLKRNEEALNLLGVYDVFSKHADFVFLMGLIYMNNGLFNEAVQEFLKAAAMKECSVDGINSYKAYYNIGVIYECTGHIREAKDAYQKCGNYEPAKARLKLLP